MAERTIKHGLFSYYEPIESIGLDGSKQQLWVERTAFRNQTVDIPRDYDLARGEEFGAFYTEEELAKRKAAEKPPNPEDPDGDSLINDGEEVELADLDDQELVDWLMSTGEFDGNKKPTVQDVVDGAGGNPELARRLLVAENTATGGQARNGVVEGLTAVTEAAVQ